MIKLIFQKFIKDTIKFFLIICFSIGLIVWIIQAVNFLDFVTEDGHGLYVYFGYTALNFPKIIHRILPFVFFISLFYQISEYEYKNELFLFWANGVNKIKFINAVILYSIIFAFFQLFLGSYISPLGQNEARSFIRSSNIDYFPSLIKEGKFIDAVSDLTIFIESKDENGVYKNIFLNESNKKDDSGLELIKSQIIYAKKGILIDRDQKRYFKLYDGKVINKDGKKLSNFTFEEIEFNLAKFSSNTILHQKIQEVSSYDLINCIYNDYKNTVEKFEAEYLRCEKRTLNDIKQEFLKRFYKPIYLPLIGLMCCLLILISKENKNYTKFKFYLFLLLFFIILISEVSLRYSTNNNIGLLLFLIFPIFLFFTIYATLYSKLNYKVKK
jgi:lipopolysaccharide export system permease protein